MKKQTQQGQQQTGRNRKVNQPRSRASAPKTKPKLKPAAPARASADETVIIQITHEDGREWARVPFSRLEHSALKAVCDLRACTMQELFNEAVSTVLGLPTPASAGSETAAPQPGGEGAATPQPGVGDTAAREKLRALEDPINISVGLVYLLGYGLAGALSKDHPVVSTVSAAACRVGQCAEALAADVSRSWDQAYDAAIQGRDERETCAKLGLHLREAAAFTHAASHALAKTVADDGDPQWVAIKEAYTALAARAFRFLDVYHKEVPVHPFRPEPMAVVKPEVAA